jgi:hypothetical protein
LSLLLATLFDQFFPRTIENFLCNGQNFPDHWAIDIK